MLTLIADRFVSDLGRGVSLAVERSIAGLDLASGDRVRLRIDAAGPRAEQQVWVEACTRKYSDGALVDFGFLGTNRRFEATSLINRCRGAHISAPSATVLEWLESRRPSSFGILYLPELPDARELRVKGFIPLSLSLLGESSLSALWLSMEGHSVVLLDACSSPARLALAVLKLRRINVRETCAVSAKFRKVGREVVVNAAEGRPAYGPRPVIDSRAGALLGDGERLLAAGRHAGAERALRAAIAACDRRGDAFHAGDAEMLLGRLLLSRGRAPDAARLFEEAHDRFQHVRAPIPAIAAMIYLGIAQTDLGLLCDAERSCRAARSAASGLSDVEMAASASVALVRTLLWQEQCSEARSVLEALTPPGDEELRARYWCLVARLHLAGNGIIDAWRGVARAQAGEPCGDAGD